MSLGTILLFIVALMLIATVPRRAHGGERPWVRQSALEALIIVAVLLLLGLW